MSDSISGFIVYPTYRIVDDPENAGKKKALVYLFGRLENGESFITISDFKPYFYVKHSDAAKAEKLVKSFNGMIEDSDFKNFSDEKVSKITLDLPSDVPKIRKMLDDEKIECYEADIRFYQRFLIDHDIKGGVKISGKFKKGNYVDRIYENPKLSKSEWHPILKTLSIDIETDMKNNNIYCISLYTEGLLLDGKHEGSYKKVLIVSSDKDMGKTLNHAITLNSEKDMLERFQSLVREIDPDIITGWNLIDFDLKVLKEHFEKHKIPFMFGRLDWLCKLELNDEFMRDSSADVPGRMVLDGIQLLKTSFVKLENYKLDTAAQQFLGEKKLVSQDNKGDEIESLYKHNQQKLVDYNLKDSEFVYKILIATKSLDLTIQRSLITGMTLERVRASVASLDSLFLRYAKQHKIVLNNSKFIEKDEPAKGGLVMDSKPGLYDYVIVCDFKSLYPSIIRTFNIDPYSYVRPEDAPKHIDKKKYIETANGALFKNQKGILPQIIEDVWKQRDEAKRKKDPPHVIYAIKIIMNSFYGVLGNPSCRFYSPEISNAITHTGQKLITLTAKNVSELGYTVIYGDTDSIFFVSGADNLDDARTVGKKVQKYINEFYKEYIEKEYHRESVLEIQFEKLFRVFLMPTIRGTEIGAKKRYAGMLVKDDDYEELSFTGMESVRGDWTDLSKKFQNELFELVFHKKEVASYIKKFVHDLKSGKHDDLLVYRKSISKPLSSYVKTTPPHVKAARMLDKLTSNIIQYVITIEGPEPVEKLKHKPDYDHYVDKQLKPIADTILSVYGLSFDDILKNSTQSSLFGY